MAGVSYGKNRKKAPVLKNLVSPTGARIVVSEERAKALLSRAPLTLPDGSAVGYEEDTSDEPTSIEASEERKAESGGGKREERQ